MRWYTGATWIGKKSRSRRVRRPEFPRRGDAGRWKVGQGRVTVVAFQRYTDDGQSIQSGITSRPLETCNRATEPEFNRGHGLIKVMKTSEALIEPPTAVSPRASTIRCVWKPVPAVRIFAHTISKPPIPPPHPPHRFRPGWRPPRKTPPLAPPAATTASLSYLCRRISGHKEKRGLRVAAVAQMTAKRVHTSRV